MYNISDKCRYDKNNQSFYVAGDLKNPRFLVIARKKWPLYIEE